MRDCKEVNLAEIASWEAAAAIKKERKTGGGIFRFQTRFGTRLVKWFGKKGKKKKHNPRRIESQTVRNSMCLYMCTGPLGFLVSPGGSRGFEVLFPCCLSAMTGVRVCMRPCVRVRACTPMWGQRELLIGLPAPSFSNLSNQEARELSRRTQWGLTHYGGSIQCVCE